MNIKSLLLTAITFILNITVSAQHAEHADSTATQLQEVIVTSSFPTTRLAGSTLVSTIAGSSLKDAGNALDVLAQLPMITVKDNMVYITGRNNIEIFIDGRPMNDSDELQRLQSSNIKKVELQMAPGAMYESTTDAVLKITTRRQFIKGLSATGFNIIEKKRLWSDVGNIDMNYNIGNCDVFASGSYNHSANRTKGFTINTLTFKGNAVEVGSSQDNRNITDAGVVKAGFNFLKDALSFGAYYRFNPEQSDFTNNGYEWLNNETSLPRTINRYISAYSHLVSMYYDNTFNKKYHLHFDGSFRSSSAETNTCTAYTDVSISDVSSADTRHSSLWAGKMYIELPLINGMFTAGTQQSYTHTSLDYRMMNDNISSYIPSFLSEARQKAAALFASWSMATGKLSLSAGMRYEYVDYDFIKDGVHDNEISRKDNLITPDISLGYSFNQHSQISISYKTATIKPPYSQLTSSLNYVGRYEIEGGNPALRDERMHDIRLFGMWHDFIVQADFTKSNDTYAFVKQQYPMQNLMLMLQPINIDVSAFSLYLIWNKAIKYWRPNVTVGIYRQWLDIEGTKYDKPVFSYYLDNTISLPHNIFITANICGQTCGDMHTNHFGTTAFTMDASVSKSFMKKALTIKLSATDIFNTACNDWKMNTYGVLVNKQQSYDRRGVSLSATYRFQPRKSRYKGEAAAEEEIKRL